jgi:hypothetical protein
LELELGQARARGRRLPHLQAIPIAQNFGHFLRLSIELSLPITVVSEIAKLRNEELKGQTRMNKSIKFESKQNESREKPKIFVKMGIERRVRKCESQQ